MKRYTLYTFSALALLLAAAACTQDDAGLLPEAPEGIPMTFTATGLNPTAATTTGTRAPVDGDWEGVQSVAVRMDGTVKAYNVTPSTSDNTGAMLTSDDPHYWTNHTDRLVTAWWPYTAGETTPPAVVVKADQSARKDFEGSDLIVAEEQTVSYGNPTLRFTHRTARVTVILTDYTEERMFVRLTGLSTENGNPAQITPYNKGGDTYTALVAPQSVVTGTAFITCKFTNGKVFVYKMKNDTDWQAGKEYTYTVSLAAAKDPGYTDLHSHLRRWAAGVERSRTERYDTELHPRRQHRPDGQRLDADRHKLRQLIHRHLRRQWQDHHGADRYGK